MIASKTIAEINVDEVIGRVHDDLMITRKQITEQIEEFSGKLNHWESQLNKLDAFMASNLLKTTINDEENPDESEDERELVDHMEMLKREANKWGQRFN